MTTTIRRGGKVVAVHTDVPVYSLTTASGRPLHVYPPAAEPQTAKTPKPAKPAKTTTRGGVPKRKR